MTFLGMFNVVSRVSPSVHRLALSPLFNYLALLSLSFKAFVPPLAFSTFAYSSLMKSMAF